MTTTRARPTAATRRIGYVIDALIGTALLVLIDARPGWHVLPFLTAAGNQVIGLLIASIAVGIAANVIYLVHDSRRARAVGGIVTAAVGLAATVRTWQVFPFDFTGYGFDWALPIRVMLIVAVVGAAIAILVNLVNVVRSGTE